MTDTDQNATSHLGIFGDYVATRAIPSEPGILLYRARRKEAPATEQHRRDHPLVAKHEKFVVKLCPGPAAPAADPGEDAAATELADDPGHNFLRSVSLQKKARDGGAQHIAPIYESHRGPEGAWYVTDYFSRGLFGSWIKLLSGVQNADELHHLVATVVCGLLELKKHCGRSHGGLNTYRILVGGKDKTLVRRSPLFLLDPLPGNEAEAAAFERADLHVLGEIIYQLVVCHGENRSFNPDDYPLDSSPSWEKLGVHGKEWLEICNQLLDPKLALDHISLETLDARLQLLKPKPAIPPWAPWAAIAAVVLVTVSVFLLWRHSQPVAYAQKIETVASTPADIVLAGRDPRGRPLRFTVVTRPKQGDLDSRSLPAVRYTPKSGFAGSDSFSFTVGNDKHKSKPAIVTILVRSLPPPNQPPVADAQQTSAVAGSPVPLILSGRDPEGKPLSYNIVTPPKQGSLLGNAPKVVYTPAANFEGTDEFTFAVSDGQTSSIPARVAILVRKPPAQNQSPVAESQAVEAGAGVGREIVLRGRDPEGKQLTFIVLETPRLGTIAGTGPTLVYTARTNAAGPDRFTFKVNDGDLDSAPAAVDITVLASRPPAISPIPAQSVDQNKTLGPLPFTVWDDHVPADKLVVEGSSTDQTLVPWDKILLAGSGSNRSVTITPASNRSGTVKIFLAVSDNHFSTVTDFVITIRSNAPPVTEPTPQPIQLAPPPVQPAPATTTVIAAPLPSVRTNAAGAELVWVAGLPGGGRWPGNNDSGGWVGKYEVTQGEYESVMGTASNPSTQKGNPRLPVENVSWNEAMAFCATLTAKEKADLPPGWHYTLPAGVQWDFLAADAAIADSITSMAPSPKRSQAEPVGSTGRPNKWGLFDVRGNVWEWSLDGPIYRGGSYASTSEGVFGGLRLDAKRSANSKDAKDSTGGFRIVLAPGN